MDVYKIGILITATNQVAPVLALIGRQLLGVQSNVNAIGRGFGGWGTALGAVGGILAAGAIFKGVVAIGKAGGEVNHQLELMKNLGMSQIEIQNAMAQASKTSGNVLTTNLVENLKHIQELRYAFGDTERAMQHLDEVSKANMVLNNIKGGGKDQVWELVKSLEMKNITSNPEEFQSYINTMTKVVQASGGRVTPQMFMSTFKYGRTATLGWDEGFIGGALPRLIQEYSAGGGGGGSGAGGPGNALMSVFAKLVQGQISKTGAETLEGLGLGNAKHIKGSSQSQFSNLKGRDLLMSNPYEWVQQILMPALKAKGLTSDQDIIEALSKAFQVRTASDIIAKMALQGRFHEGVNSPFEKDIGLQKKPTGIGAYDDLIKNDVPAIMKAFHEQFHNLLQTIGGPLMAPGGPVVSAMASIVSVMGQMGQFAAAHPEGMKMAFEVIIGFLAGLATIGLGALAVLIAPLIGAGGLIAGVVVALGTLAAFNWSSIIDAISSFLAKLKGLFSSGSVPGQFGKDLKERNENYVPMRFDPGASKTLKAMPISLSLNVDGRALAQVMSDQLEYLYQHSQGAPAPNRLGQWASGDSNFIAT